MEQTLSLSTHVLDLHSGLPASNITVKLYKYENESWFESQSFGITDGDGRFKNFHKVNENICGTYKIKFETLEYFNRLNITSFFPFVEASKTF